MLGVAQRRRRGTFNHRPLTAAVITAVRATIVAVGITIWIGAVGVGAIRRIVVARPVRYSGDIRRHANAIGILVVILAARSCRSIYVTAPQSRYAVDDITSALGT